VKTKRPQEYPPEGIAGSVEINHDQPAVRLQNAPDFPQARALHVRREVVEHETRKYGIEAFAFERDFFDNPRLETRRAVRDGCVCQSDANHVDRRIDPPCRSRRADGLGRQLGQHAGAAAYIQRILSRTQRRQPKRTLPKGPAYPHRAAESVVIGRHPIQRHPARRRVLQIFFAPGHGAR
jgi:hypothetical protein